MKSKQCRQCIGFVIALCAVFIGPEGVAQEKRALIVTIGNYLEGTDWTPISSDRDYALIEQSLKLHGFPEANISRLAESDATREGIVDAIRTELLSPADSGDVLVFHFSGHGQQIADDSGDEIDGYDEALVPWDAPKRPPDGYTGELHLRDDELGGLLGELRAKVGPDGDVIVFLDSCHSGTATRGDDTDYPYTARGTNEAIGSPGGPVSIESAASGFLDESASRGANGADESDLAPLVVLAAEKHSNLAEETYDEEGQQVGSLTWAVSSALAEAGAETSYRDIFEAVRIKTSARLIPNKPQAEGQLDRLLFAGRAVAQDPFFRISAMDLSEPAPWVQIAGGALVGLMDNAGIEIHRLNTRTPGPETLIASGTISYSTPFTSEAMLDEVVDAAAIDGQVFVTRHAFGSLRVAVYVDAPEDSGWGNQVRTALANAASESSSLINLLDARPAEISDDATRVALIRQISSGPPSQRGIMLETWDSGQALLSRPLNPANENMIPTLLANIVQYGRNSYLRALNVKSDGMQVEVDVIPCRLQCSGLSGVCGSPSCTCAEELDINDFIDEGNNLSMPVGSGFIVQMRNVGANPVYTNILDLMPDGNIGMMWPLPSTSEEDTLLREGSLYRILRSSDGTQPMVYRVCPPLGTDVIKLITTTQPVDLTPVANNVSGANRGSRGPLDDLLYDSLSGSRGFEPTFEPGTVSTSNIIVTITESE